MYIFTNIKLLMRIQMSYKSLSNGNKLVKIALINNYVIYVINT